MAKSKSGKLTPKEELDLLRRGTVEITTEEELLEKLKKSRQTGKPLRVKLGVDPSSPDIHLGHTVVLRKLRQFQDLGHKAVLIIGDGTALIGDPSGQNKTRPQLTPDEVAQNARTYFDQVSTVLDMGSVEIKYNGEWLKSLTFEEILTLAAKVTVARIMERDDFTKRWAAHTPIHLHELLYPVLQGYDSVVVRADVELGGTDQTFNLLMGRQMQRDAGARPQVTITMPILVGLDGTEKMSKSKGNYIGVTDEAREMYGKIMSIPDALMENYFKLLTPVPEADYRRELADGHPREVKARLALRIVEQFHTAALAATAAEHFDRVFRDREVPDEMPEITLSADQVEDGKIWIVKLILAAGFASSSSDARRLISQGAVSIDAEKITNSSTDVTVRTGQVLKVGKRRFGRIAADYVR